MNTARMLAAAAAAAALMAGTAMAQTTPNTGQPADAQGMTPATDDGTTDANQQTPPTAPGDTAMQPGMTTEQTMSTQGSMDSNNAGGQMGAEASGNMNAGGAMGANASGNMNAGGAMAGGTTQVTAMQPIPDTPENRARYGQPESASGKRTIGEGPVGQTRRSGRRR